MKVISFMHRIGTLPPDRAFPYLCNSRKTIPRRSGWSSKRAHSA